MSTQKQTSFAVLNDVWWTIYDALENVHPDVAIRRYVTRQAFTSLLRQVGWTVEEWNAANATARAARRGTK